MKKILTIIALIGSIFLLSRCDVFKSNTFKFNVTITYQYEDTPNVDYILTMKDIVTFNGSVKTCTPEYTVTPGYTNELTLHRRFKDANISRENSWVLIMVPDRKFKVTSITYYLINE